MEAGQIAQWVEALAIKYDNLCSVPGTHTWWKERSDFHKIFSDSHTLAVAHTYKFTYT